jgi:dolichyl-diphosphooligosaccharide--protein glycosyltransferase
MLNHHLGRRIVLITFSKMKRLFIFSFDQVRHVEIGNKNFDLQHVEEAYTTEHWIVRIYKVKKLSNRLQAKDALRRVRRLKSIYSSAKKSSEQGQKQGVILNKPQIKKGTKVSASKRSIENRQRL